MSPRTRSATVSGVPAIISRALEIRSTLDLPRFTLADPNLSHRQEGFTNLFTTYLFECKFRVIQLPQVFQPSQYIYTIVALSAPNSADPSISHLPRPDDAFPPNLLPSSTRRLLNLTSLCLLQGYLDELVAHEIHRKARVMLEPSLMGSQTRRIEVCYLPSVSLL